MKMLSDKGSIFCHLLLQKFSETRGAINALPEEMQKTLLKAQIPDSPLESVWIAPKTIIERIHYSWFLPVLQKLNPKTQTLLLSALNTTQSNGLSKLLSLPTTKKTMSEPVQHYFLANLKQALLPKDFLPVEYLPHGDLKQLLALNKPELMQLIDYLGIYDLAEEMRHLIDKERIKVITKLVPKENLPFLRRCLRHSEKIPPPRLHLDRMELSKKKLSRMLHKNGILRLSKALSGVHPQTVRHIAYILDTGRGHLLLQHVRKEEMAGITPFMLQQTLNALEFLKQASAS